MQEYQNHCASFKRRQIVVDPIAVEKIVALSNGSQQKQPNNARMHRLNFCNKYLLILIIVLLRRRIF